MIKNQCLDKGSHVVYVIDRFFLLHSQKSESVEIMKRSNHYRKLKRFQSRNIIHIKVRQPTFCFSQNSNKSSIVHSTKKSLRDDSISYVSNE